jgi:hypothetical protein
LSLGFQLCTTTWRHTGGVKVWLHAFLTSALNAGEWSASRPSRFIPRERDPGTHWIGGWVGPRAGPDTVVKRKIPSPCRDSNPRPYSTQPSAILLSYSGLHLLPHTLIPAVEHPQYLPDSDPCDVFHAPETNSILTYFMVQDIIWKAVHHSACQKMPLSYGTHRFITVSQKPATGPYPEPDECSSSHRSLSP